MRCFTRYASLALLAAVLLQACTRTPVAQAPTSFALYFTCDTNGRIEPCGCFTGQSGGLTRLKTFLNSRHALDALLVDVGDAIEGTADYQLIKYGYIQRAYAAMGYAAMNVGAREAQLPASELKRLKASAPVPMISANLLDAADGTPLFEPCRVVEYRGRKIAFVGVVDPGHGGEGLGEGVAVEPMAAALAKVLPSLRGKVDLFVLLAFADEVAMRALARQFYEFDVILGGKVKQPSQNLETENRSLILYTTNESKAVGFLKGQLAEPSKLKFAQFDIVFLDDGIPQDQAISGQSQEYRAQIRQMKLAVDDPERLAADQVPGVMQSARYVGSESCATCHVSAAKAWQTSGHASAFGALVRRDSEADPSCIGCHTVGFGTPSGYRREFAGARLTDVGCESCHGPGSEHVAQRRSSEKVLFKYRPLGAADCASCHHGEFSRPFDFATFWPEIKHGKEGSVAQK